MRLSYSGVCYLDSWCRGFDLLRPGGSREDAQWQMTRIEASLDVDIHARPGGEYRMLSNETETAASCSLGPRK